MTLRPRLPHTLRRITFPSLRAGAALVAAVAVAGALGCGSDKSTGPGSIAGTYNVVSISGPQGTDNSAPFTLIDTNIEGTPFRAEMPSGSVTLNSNGRYTGTGFVNVYIDDVLDPDFSGESFPSDGKWTRSGSTVTFTPDDTSEPPTTASISGNTLTFTETDTDPSLGTITFTIVLKK
jgi:hypothetical protein